MSDLIFGTFTNPIQSDRSVSYLCPSILPEETMRKISFSEEPCILIEEENISDEVTHGQFFGENIRRVKNTLFPKK